jgi:hypothetical protein
MSGCVILATNQVRDKFFLLILFSFSLYHFVSVQITPVVPNSSDSLIEKIIHDGNEYLPTLGRAWYHCVTTRLSMTSLPAGSPQQRIITVQKSPLVPLVSHSYNITAKGIVDN